MAEERVYLDVNILREWFVRMIRGDEREVYYVRFLSERKEIKKFISIFGIAEIIETLKKEPKLQHKNLTKDLILSLIDALRNTIDLKIIEEDEKGQYSGIILSPKIVNFTFTSHSHAAT